MKPSTYSDKKPSMGAVFMLFHLMICLCLWSAMGLARAQSKPDLGEPGQNDRHQMMGERPWGGPHSKEQLDRMWAKRIERFDHRQAQLKARLKITPAQESAWAQFVQATRPAQVRPQPEMDRDQMRALMQLSAPQRMEKMMLLREKVQVQMNQRMHERLEAVKALYPQLSAEQQKEFDRFTLHHKRMHWGRAKEE